MPHRVCWFELIRPCSQGETFCCPAIVEVMDSFDLRQVPVVRVVFPKLVNERLCFVFQPKIVEGLYSIAESWTIQRVPLRHLFKQFERALGIARYA